MFVQVIQGKVSDRDELRAQVQRWADEVSPGAAGWLGSTGGVTDDGTMIAVVRFESEEAARTNSDRPEQDAWWGQTAKLFTDEPTFQESTQVEVDLAGDPDQAGFVQVIKGYSSDPERARGLMSQDHDARVAFRPDILGSLGIGHDEGGFTAVLYFRSEAEAREGEAKEPPPELKSRMEEMGRLAVGEPTFLDLREPWMHSPS
jgi:hypothetical protein